MPKSREVHFEDEVFDVLTTTSGWLAGDAADIDLPTGIFSYHLIQFIADTQITEWNKLLANFSGDPDRAQVEFRRRVAAEIDARGTIDVLRRGVKGWGCSFQPDRSAKLPSLAWET